MNIRPAWLEYIRVYKQTTIGSSKPPVFIIGFGPRNLCKSMESEVKADMLAESIKEWICIQIQGHER